MDEEHKLNESDTTSSPETPKMEEVAPPEDENQSMVPDIPSTSEIEDDTEPSRNGENAADIKIFAPLQNKLLKPKMDPDSEPYTEQEEHVEVSTEKEELISFSAEEHLRCTLEEYGESFVVFLRNRDCIFSLEVATVIEGFIERSFDTKDMVLVDVEEISLQIQNFGDFLSINAGKGLPLVYFQKRLIGDHSDIMNADMFHRLDMLLHPPPFPLYNIVIIGGGTGALRALRELEKRDLNLNIGLIDWVAPSEDDQEQLLFGLGPFSQGHIPADFLRELIQRIEKQINAETLLHRANMEDRKNHWEQSLNDRKKYVNYLNCSYRKKLISSNVEYYHGKLLFHGTDYVTIVSEVDGAEKSENIAAMCYIICGGSVPQTPKFPGKEFCLTLDKFIFENQLPSRTLIIANTPLGFGIANLLSLYNCNVTLMTDQKEWLPQFDRDCVKHIISMFRECGVKLIIVDRINSVTKLREDKYQVSVELEGVTASKRFNIVITDYGREPVSSLFELEDVGIRIDSNTNKIIVDNDLRTSIKGIWAFGETVQGHLESSNFITQAAKRVIALICDTKDRTMLPEIEPTVVLAPTEYAFVGETLESAIIKNKEKVKLYESDNLELILHSQGATQEGCFTKMICLSLSDECSHGEELEFVIGLHFLGKSAGQLVNGFALSVERGLSKIEFLEMFSTQSSRDLGLYYTTFQEKDISQALIDALNKETKLKEAKSSKHDMGKPSSSKELTLQPATAKGSTTEIHHLGLDVNIPLNVDVIQTEFNESMSVSDKEEDAKSTHDMIVPFEWNEEVDDQTATSSNIISEDSITEIGQPRLSSKEHALHPAITEGSGTEIHNLELDVNIPLNVVAIQVEFNESVYVSDKEEDAKSTHDMIVPFEWNEEVDDQTATSSNIISEDSITEIGQPRLSSKEHALHPAITEVSGTEIHNLELDVNIPLNVVAIQEEFNESMSVSDKEEDAKSTHDMIVPFEWNEEVDDQTATSSNIISEDSITEIGQPRHNPNTPLDLYALQATFNDMFVGHIHSHKTNSDEESSHSNIESFEWQDSDDSTSENQFTEESSFIVLLPEESDENLQSSVHLPEEPSCSSKSDMHNERGFPIQSSSAPLFLFSSSTKSETLSSKGKLQFDSASPIQNVEYECLGDDYMERMERAYLQKISQKYSFGVVGDESTLFHKSPKPGSSHEPDEIDDAELEYFRFQQGLMDDIDQNIDYHEITEKELVGSDGVIYMSKSIVKKNNMRKISTDNLVEELKKPICEKITIFNLIKMDQYRRVQACSTCTTESSIIVKVDKQRHFVQASSFNRMEFTIMLQKDTQFLLAITSLKIELKMGRSLLHIYNNRWILSAVTRNGAYAEFSVYPKSRYQPSIRNSLNSNEMSTNVSDSSENDHGSKTNSYISQDSDSFICDNSASEGSHYIVENELCQSLTDLTENKFEVDDLESQNPVSNPEQ